MKARGVDCGLRTFAEAHPVKDREQYARDDARAAARASDEAKLAIAQENCRYHRAKRALAGSNRVCFGLNEADPIRRTRVRSEIVHFVVEEIAVAGGDAGAVEIVESVSVGDSVAGRINGGEVGCLAVGCGSSEVAIEGVVALCDGDRTRDLRTWSWR